MANKNHTNSKSEKFAEFVENINTDEIRSGFLVTSHRKKLWNVQINLINEFARICEKHNLCWFAYGGTLLGAARHKGFVPWDDDVDLAMLRPEYEKFKKIAPHEIKPPYFLDNWYDYRLEEDEKVLPEESNFPLITRKDKDKNYGYWPFFPLIKIRDSRTTMLELPRRKNVNQGIWIDIFPMDPSPPFENQQQEILFTMEGELLTATVFSGFIRNAIETNQPLIIDTSVMKEFLSMTYREKAMFVDNFMLEKFFPSKYVGQLRNRFFVQDFRHYQMAHFTGDVVYLPFEKIKVPAPVNYAEKLQEIYGDWRTIKIYDSHSNDWSADIPYDEYLKKIP